VLFDNFDTAKMHGHDTSNVSSREVTSQVEFELMCVKRSIYESGRFTNEWVEFNAPLGTRLVVSEAQ